MSLKLKLKNILAIGTSHQVIKGKWSITSIWLKDGAQMNIPMCPSLSFYSSNIIQRDLVRCKYVKDQSPLIKACLWCKAL